MIVGFDFVRAKIFLDCGMWLFIGSQLKIDLDMSEIFFYKKAGPFDT